MAATAPTVPTTEISRDAKPNSGKAVYARPASSVGPTGSNPAHAVMFPLGLSISCPAPVPRQESRYPRMSHSMAQAYCPYLPPINLSAPNRFIGFTIPAPSLCHCDGDWCLLADPEIDLPRQNMFLNGSWRHQETGFKNCRLHNLRTDAAQEIDLSEKEPDRFAKMKAQMLKLTVM